MNGLAAIQIENISYSYAGRQALRELSLDVRPGEIFAILGPNGGGKTTLFRLLSTLIPLQAGEAAIFGDSLRTRTAEIRQRIGVVFQAPSLDRKLTVLENIRHQAALYGLFGGELRTRERQMLEQFALTDRANELTEKLSGGLRRRVELAKGLIHRPRLLLLDEPSTGLDPGARSDLWQYLRRLREEHGVTIVLTTHFLDEADSADRIAILNAGELVALDTPESLRRQVGGDSISIEAARPDALAAAVREQLSLDARVIEGALRIEAPDGHRSVSQLMEAFPDEIAAIRLGKPTLEDVFIARTGHRFWSEKAGAAHE